MYNVHLSPIATASTNPALRASVHPSNPSYLWQSKGQDASKMQDLRFDCVNFRRRPRPTTLFVSLSRFFVGPDVMYSVSIFAVALSKNSDRPGW
jgi:hypothetical protein